MISLGNFIKRVRIPILHKHFQKTEEEGTLPNSFYEDSVILMPKPNKVIKRKLQINIPYEEKHKRPQQNINILNM